MRRTLILLPAFLAVSCTTGKETVPVPQPAPQVFEKPLPKTDIQNLIMTEMNNSSVTVFPLNAPAADPFDNKDLQPLSDKVIADGYVVTDPSVNVYPPRPPQAMPAMLPMEGGVRQDAASAIVGARQKAADVTQVKMPPAPPLNDGGVYGGPISAEPLPPVATEIWPTPVASGAVAGTVPMPPMPDAVIGADQAAVGGKPMGWVGAAPLPAGQMAVIPSNAWGSNTPALATISAPPAAGTKSGPVDTSYGGTATIAAPPAPIPPAPGLMPPVNVPQFDQSGSLQPGMLTSASTPTIEKVAQ